jgi:small-conductance mechanosensitive channel
MKYPGHEQRNKLRVFCFVLSLLASVGHALGQDPVLKPKGEAGSPVVIDGQTVATVYSVPSVGTGEQRAAAIQERLYSFARNYRVPEESIRAGEAGGLVGVVAAESLIMAITPEDAAGAGRPRLELAQEYAENIRGAVHHFREQRRLSRLLAGTLKSLGVTVVLGLLLVGFTRLSRIVRRAVGRMIRRQVDATRPRATRQILAVRLGRIFLLLWEVFRWLLFVVFLWLYLVIILRFFPGTAGLADSIAGWILSPVATLTKQVGNYIPNLFFLVVLGVFTYYSIKLSGFFFGEIREGRLTFSRFYPEWADQTHRLVRTFLIILAAIVAFPYLPGSSSPAFQGVSIFLGVLISLGSTSAVANVVAGVILTYMREFKVGDRVRVGETEGDVVEMALLVTRLRTIKNVEVSIPNSTLLSNYVQNYSVAAREKNLILHTSVTIGYDAPWRQVHALLKQAAARTPAILSQPAPFILQTALNDFYVTYELNAYTDQPYEMPFTYSHLHKNIQDAFNEYGVQIMSPNYLGDRSVPTLVPKDRWYLPPAKPPGDPEADS